jgi:hypothetical protein
VTKKDALKIRKFRKSGTWRAVAKMAAEEWPDREYCSGNQIEGMELCREAAKILKQNPLKAPWN